MQRRQFISLIGAAGGPSFLRPLAAHAQPAGKLPTIGYFGSATAGSPREAAFVKRLHDLGWIEGRTVAIEYRWAGGQTERFAEIAAEFVRLKVDVIVTAATAPVAAAKQATSAIPIVFALAADPVGDNLVAGLARPGGNVTGLSIQTIDLSGKRIELLREIVPHLRRLAILANIASPAATREMGEVQATTSALGLEVTKIGIQTAGDITHAFETLKNRVDALYVCADPLIYTSRIQINSLALEARMPTIYVAREYVDAAGLMSYGPNAPDLYRRAAELVDKILRGAKPGEIPVEQPTKFELVVNLKTATALGLKIPETFLLRADEVIE
jgi:putative ABC transport system substrate-binding protein